MLFISVQLFLGLVDEAFDVLTDGVVLDGIAELSESHRYANFSACPLGTLISGSTPVPSQLVLEIRIDRTADRDERCEMVMQANVAARVGTPPVVSPMIVARLRFWRLNENSSAPEKV